MAVAMAMKAKAAGKEMQSELPPLTSGGFKGLKQFALIELIVLLPLILNVSLY